MPHTPGPWTVLMENGQIAIRHEPQYMTICTMDFEAIGDDPVAIKAAKDDASLIAAAPALLEACEAALAWHKVTCQALGEMCTPGDADLLGILEDAIAQAKGGA